MLWFYILLLTCGLTGLWIYLLRILLRRASPPPPWISVLAKAILPLIILSAAFTGAEAYYRFLVDEPDAFALSLISKRWGERYYQFNNLNVRAERDYPLKKTSGKRRISFLGDSFTAGHGLKDPQDRFVNLLGSWHPDWETHALAANGDEIPDHLAHFIGLQQQGYEFGELVMVYNLNDLSPYLRETEALYEEIREFKANWGFWTRNSYFVNTWACRLWARGNERMQGQRDALLRGYESEAWTKGGRPALDELIGRSRAAGIRLTVVIFPFLRPLDATEPFADLYPRLEAYFRSRQVDCLNLRPMFLRHAEEELVVSEYDSHPNEYAHLLAAKEMEELLE